MSSSSDFPERKLTERAKRGGDRLGRHLEHRPARRGHERGDVRGFRRRVRRNHLHVVGHVRPRSRSRSLAGSERLCPAAISRRQSRDVRFPGTGASVDSPAESSPMPEIGARRFHHARLSRVLARPDATRARRLTRPARRAREQRRRANKKENAKYLDQTTAGNVGKTGFLFYVRGSFRSTCAFPAGIPNARGATGSRHHGAGSLVPREQDGGSREATGGLRGAHGGNHGEVRGSVRAAKSVTRPAIGPWGGVRHRTPPSVFPSRATPVAPHAVVADPLASASSRPSPAGRKLEPAHEDARVLGQGQDAEHCAYARMPLPRALTRAARRPSAFPARAPRLFPRARDTSRTRIRRTRARRAPRVSGARATDRELPARRLPARGAPETLPHPRDRPKSQKPQYKFSQEPMLTGPGRAQNW